MTDAAVGHNAPPADADPLRDRLGTEYEALVGRHDDLISAFDRAPGEIDDKNAGPMADFIKQISAHVKTLDTARVAEKEPYLAGGRTIDGYFKGMTDKLKGNADTLRSRLTIYERAKAAEERRRREAEERRQRADAARLAKEAEERAAAAQTETDLEAAVEVEAQASEAQSDAALAAKAADAKPAALHTTRGDYGASSSLRTYWDFDDLRRDVVDLEELRYHLTSDALEKALRAFIKAGGRTISGARIFENTRSVVR